MSSTNLCVRFASCYEPAISPLPLLRCAFRPRFQHARERELTYISREQPRRLIFHAFKVVMSVKYRYRGKITSVTVHRTGEAELWENNGRSRFLTSLHGICKAEFALHSFSLLFLFVPLRLYQGSWAGIREWHDDNGERDRGPILQHAVHRRHIAGGYSAVAGGENNHTVPAVLRTVSIHIFFSFPYSVLMSTIDRSFIANPASNAASRGNVRADCQYEHWEKEQRRGNGTVRERGVA